MKKEVIDRKRHIAKTITWRIVGSIDTMILGWLISGDVTIGMTIGGFEVLTKMFLYYFHERAWYKINFGLERRKRKKTILAERNKLIDERIQAKYDTNPEMFI